MNRFYSTLFVLIFNILFAHGQSTDHVKLYVLYDISHSTKINNSDSNLYQLAAQLMQIESSESTSVKDSARIGMSIDFIPFGEAKDDSQIEKKIIRMNRKNVDYGRDESAEIARNLDLLTYKNDEIQKYTHLKEALYKINEQESESFGVFIITDGQLELGDINHNDNGEENVLSYLKKLEKINNYREEVKSYLETLRVLGHPAYIVQSSETPLNKYYVTDSAVMKEYRNGKSEVIIREDFFWIKNTADPKAKRNKSLSKNL